MSFILETQRLGLRALTPEDLDDLRQIQGDAETMRYYTAPFTRDATKDWIDRMIERYRLDGHALWAVVLKETGEFVGNVGPMKREVDGRDDIEIGWQINKSHWGKGYATEAGAACRDWVFENREIDRVISLISPENEASRRVAEKLGMSIDKAIEWAGLAHYIYAVTSRRTAT